MAISRRRKALADLKKELKRLKSIETKNIDASMQVKCLKENSRQEMEDNETSAVQEKMARKKLMRKLERKGLSRNAIKTQLRPCLTSGNAIEERLEDNKVEVNRGGIMMKREVPMSKICKLCGKKILGDILDHFSEKHFSFYVANKETIMSHSGAFTVDEDKYDSKIHLARNIEVIKPHKNHTQNNKQTTETPPKKTHVFNHRKMRGIISDLEEHPQEQTYRGWNLFMCDGCEKTCKHGRVIFVNMKRTLHLCYDCYKHAKSIVKFKRGNKHVYINTPM
ncbi:MAG: hypothetical protein U0I09_02100 [Bacteroidaceae bacterium]|nr:hypothetical protein [Bacteroidaceae bacterium]MEE1141436.1 hypothetical protein [Prevotella sp.]